MAGSMAGPPPSWPVMLSRMRIASFSTAVGTLRWRSPDHAPVASTRIDFWFERPDRYRCHDSEGLCLLATGDKTIVRSDQGTMTELPPGMMSGEEWHPYHLLGGNAVADSLCDPDDFSQPTGPAVADTVAGRQCWRFTLAPPSDKPAPLEVAIDDQTAVILELRSRELDGWLALARFEPEVVLPDGIFDL